MPFEPSNLPFPPVSSLLREKRPDRQAGAMDAPWQAPAPGSGTVECEAFRIVDADALQGGSAGFWRRRTTRLLERQKKQRR